MRIQSILPQLHSNRNMQSNHNLTLQNYPTNFIPNSDKVSFSSKHRIIPIKTVKAFKERAIQRGGYHCMYCSVLMKYDEALFNTWKNDNLFSLPIGAFVKRFRKYKECLHTSEREIFEYVEYISRKNPQAKLDTVIKIMSTKANKELLKSQEPIFNKMAVLANKLPEENKTNVLNLIAKSRYRMLRIPHEEEFSGKEIRYKIENFTKAISDPKLAKRINSLTELLTIPAIYKQTEPITDKIVLRILKTISPNAKTNKINNIKINYPAKRLNTMIIQAIKTETKNHKKKDIYNLCLEAEKQLNGEPIMGKFSNRSFVYDLKEALLGLEDTNPLRAELFKQANSLPTSSDNVYAFITKHDQLSPEKIAYDLFTPSELTIEHQKPSFLGGIDSIINWAIACKRCNNTRQHSDMGEFYKMFKKFNAQKYWNEIIEDANKGYFDFEDVVNMLKIFKDESGIKIKSKHLKCRPSYSE